MSRLLVKFKAGARAAGVMLVALGVSTGALAASGEEMHMHHHGAHVGADVMPFDLARSLHIFAPTRDGGLQDVVSRDHDQRQIALIRSHLEKEAAAFARGDYADPAKIHGADMPGLAALAAGADRMRVRFETLPEGGRIRFESDDPALVQALHLWFARQAHDHGADAVLRE